MQQHVIQRFVTNAVSTCRLPIIPIAAGTGGILFPECQQKIKVSGEELTIVRSIEAEQLPLFGYCTIGEVLMLENIKT